MLTYRKTTYYPKQVPYIDLVSNLNFLTLEDRRKIFDFLFLHKLLNNRIDNPEILSKLFLRIPTGKTRTGITGTFFCAKARTNILSKSPLWRMSASYIERITKVMYLIYLVC